MSTTRELRISFYSVFFRLSSPQEKENLAGAVH